MLIPRPGIEPTHPAVEAQILNHLTTREVQYTPRPCMLPYVIETLVGLPSFNGLGKIGSQSQEVQSSLLMSFYLGEFHFDGYHCI